MSYPWQRRPLGNSWKCLLWCWLEQLCQPQDNHLCQPPHQCLQDPHLWWYWSVTDAYSVWILPHKVRSNIIIGSSGEGTGENVWVTEKFRIMINANDLIWSPDLTLDPVNVFWWGEGPALGEGLQEGEQVPEWSQGRQDCLASDGRTHLHHCNSCSM